jgi:type IV pilus assembly protein PilY1
VAKLSNGEWAVIFGGLGYGSSNGSTTVAPALFIVSLDTGKLIRKIDVPTLSSPGVVDRNGLFASAAADLNNDGAADFVFAGDLQGNLYKFDLTGSAPEQWNISNGGRPLFTARTSSGVPQPILSRPEVVKGPAGAGVTVLVVAGTPPIPAQPAVRQLHASLYAIYDRDDESQIDRRNLVGLHRSDSGQVSAISGPALLPAYSGWYLDLQTSSATEESENFSSQLVIRDSVAIVKTQKLQRGLCRSEMSEILAIDTISGRVLRRPRSTAAEPEVAYGVSVVALGAATDVVLDTPVVIDSSGESGQCMRYVYFRKADSSIDHVTLACRTSGRRSWRQLQ